jgi:hypothetical protein
VTEPVKVVHDNILIHVFLAPKFKFNFYTEFLGKNTCINILSCTTISGSVTYGTRIKPCTVRNLAKETKQFVRFFPL